MKRKLPIKIVVADVLAIIMSALAIICGAIQIAFLIADDFEIWSPDYEQIDLTPILEKDVLTDDDYKTLYRQTGLTKIGVDRALKKGAVGKRRVRAIQKDYFAKHEIVHQKFAPFTCFCQIDGVISICELETGDIIVSPFTNLLGWRMGHSALIADEYGTTLEIAAIGTKSKPGTVNSFTNKIAFMVLSPKVDTETRQKAVDFARDELMDVWYNPLRGVFSSKYEFGDTQCAHLVWYAYNHFGIDLDSSGGGIVTPQDMANSELVEVVQVFGFDPEKLWK